MSSEQWNIDNRNTEEFKVKHRRWDNTWRRSNSKKSILKGLRSSSKRRNLEFNLTEEDINIPEVCPVLGTKFEYGTPYGISIDRIDNSKGYIKGNIQIMSNKANAMKNNATPEELKKFGEWCLNQSIS